MRVPIGLLVAALAFNPGAPVRADNLAAVRHDLKTYYAAFNQAMKHNDLKSLVALKQFFTPGYVTIYSDGGLVPLTDDEHQGQRNTWDHLVKSILSSKT